MSRILGSVIDNNGFQLDDLIYWHVKYKYNQL
jgi:hypothetical protein